jgi:hypothetical protein
LMSCPNIYFAKSYKIHFRLIAVCRISAPWVRQGGLRLLGYYK